MDKKKLWIIISASVTGGVIFSYLTIIVLAKFIMPVGFVTIPGGVTVFSKDDYENYKEFQKLFSVKDTLYKAYDGEINEEDLVAGAIKGMTNSLNDPYTVFMDKKEYEEFSKETQGTYAGIGVMIKKNDKDMIEIVTVYDNSPAQKSGLKKGDVIARVNGTNVTGSDMNKAVTMMTGEVGKSVVATVLRDNALIDITMKTAKIERNTIEGEIISDKIGYLKIREFDKNTSDNLIKELGVLNSKDMKGIIIDLRGNPGGYLDQVIKVASNFVKKGEILTSTIDKYNEKQEYKSTGGISIGLPMVVLVDEGSASASEIFTGVIKDYKLGTIVGKTTFGKGVVQTLYDTKDGTALKVTISKYYTPSGENIHKIGIKPDVEVEYPKDLYGKEYDRSKDPQFGKALEIITSKIK